MPNCPDCQLREEQAATCIASLSEAVEEARLELHQARVGWARERDDLLDRLSASDGPDSSQPAFGHHRR